ncbi:Type IV fimbrial biogenesis protein PilY1 [Labilithrix luteola]|uniref:Type IV fimbrial biogenesis protein PilY1 n=1 Tax=Labilithrix luteola TaxID=1391654 RepID=A0A0K1Q3B6_9BACT|nr:hypothetical protein [Labilithrix luteola]AKV00341.1 Type IV fimbrial biogenesis protein PilY1 [Labilithrix luteola]
MKRRHGLLAAIFLAYATACAHTEDGSVAPSPSTQTIPTPTPSLQDDASVSNSCDGGECTPAIDCNDADLCAVGGFDRLPLLNAIWAAASDDVWIAGGDGVVFHWNGSDIRKVQSGTTQPLRAIWGRGPNDFWIGGGSATLLHYTAETAGAEVPFRQASNNCKVRYEGRGGYLPTCNFISLWSSGDLPIFTVSPQTTTTYRFSTEAQTSWTAFPPTCTPKSRDDEKCLDDSRAVWGSGAGIFGSSASTDVRFDRVDRST